MEYRRFEGLDEATAHNLHRLDHFSRQDYPLSRDLLDDFLVAVIQTHRLLPMSIQDQLPIGRCFTHGTHATAEQAWRDKLWAEIRTDLGGGLQRVLGDPSLKRLYAAKKDRPETRGERILGLCEEFAGTSSAGEVTRRLQMASVGTQASSDAQELHRLVTKKRIANTFKHSCDVQRYVDRIRIIARQLHHLP